MQRLRAHIVLLLCCCIFALSHADTVTRVKVQPVAPLVGGHQHGLAACFAGTIDGTPYIAGGANFPDVPCAEGGTKHFYQDIYAYDGQCWTQRGKLPFGVASGASANIDPQRILCVGGQGDEGLHREAFILSADGITPLPDLPIALAEHSVCIYQHKAYVVGGRSDSRSNLHVYSIDTDHPATGWQVVATLPDGARLQPVCIVQTGATAARLFVFGGYNPDIQPATARTDGRSLDLQTFVWQPTAPLPDGMTLVGSVATTSGYSHILCFGGVNKQVFEARLNDATPTNDYFTHAPAWYRFNDRILVYHTITNTWFALTQNSAFARAGAGLMPWADGFLMVGGETMPGIRSTDVTHITVEQPRSFGWGNWSVLVLYLLGMLLLGYCFMRRESSTDDFFRGGGRIPWWAAGISIYATMLSAITYMSIPAKAYATNWTYYPMLIGILIVSFPVIKYYLPYFRRLSITSAYEYLEIRFNAATRFIASGLFIAFMVARMALVLYLPSLALTAVTGIDISLCIILMGLITVIYCTMGGVEAVVWGDVIQGIILVGGAFFIAGWLIFHTEGGVGGFVQTAIDYDKFKLFEWSLDYRSVTFWVAIVGGLANNLISYTSDQTVIQRYLTTKDEKSAAHSILMNGIMCVAVSVVFYVIGTGLFTFFHTHPDHLDLTMDKGDAILPYLMMAEMPQGVAGLLIAAIFAATMSTISSNINSVSTAFSIDFWQRLRPQTTERGMMRVARLTCVISGLVGVVLALMMATWDILSLLDYFNTILGLLTGGLGGLFFIGVFMPKIGGRAALTGFVTSTLFVFYLQYFTEANLFLFGGAGIVVCVVVAWLMATLCKEDINVVKLK